MGWRLDAGGMNLLLLMTMTVDVSVKKVTAQTISFQRKSRGV
jgi:hypothetical protein